MSTSCFDEIESAAAAVEARLGISRREFAQFCAATASTLGLAAGSESAIAQAVHSW